MEKNTYTILEEKREDMEKKLRRLQKKAQKYNIPFAVSYGDTYAMEIDNVNEYGVKVTNRYEIFDLTIESETIKKNGYTVVAQLEHSEEGNIVNVFEGQMQTAWANCKPFCEHCNSNHNLKHTFMVSNGEEIKQVGRTCLKEYCGIDPQVIGMMNQFFGEIEEDTAEGYDFHEKILCVYDAVDILSLAIETVHEQGYVKSDEKGSNRSMISDKLHDGRCNSPKYYDEAEKMAKAIAEMPVEEAVDALLNNVQTRIKGMYCKPSELGYFAYAPVAYEKHMKRIAEQKRRQAEKDAMGAVSKYVGTIGERTTFDVKETKLLTSFENDYGITFLYRFIDTNDNVLIWFGSTTISDDTRKIKATVKSHTEREGVKQTIITRVKVA